MSPISVMDRTGIYLYQSLSAISGIVIKGKKADRIGYAQTAALVSEVKPISRVHNQPKNETGLEAFVRKYTGKGNFLDMSNK